MPTLDELRRWARGEPVEGLPAIAVRKSGDRPAVDPTRRTSRRYKLNDDNTDALLQFGLYRGQSVSSLVATARGRKYLSWILDRDFDDALKAVCRYHMELVKRG